MPCYWATERRCQITDFAFSLQQRDMWTLCDSLLDSQLPLIVMLFHLRYPTCRCHIISGRTKDGVFPSCKIAQRSFSLGSDAGMLVAELTAYKV